MRLVVQRVSRAKVDVDGATVGSIGAGLAVLAGVGMQDSKDAARRLASRLARLRIFGDEHGKMNLAVTDAGGAVLVVPQFTLYANTRKGNRPSFAESAAPGPAKAIIAEFVTALRAEGIEVSEGQFGAHMEVTLTNDGPVTIILDDREAAP